MSSTDTLFFRGLCADSRQKLNHMQGLIVMGGGVPVRAAGSLVGAIGVSGAPGAEKNAVCADTALDDVQERLELAF